MDAPHGYGSRSRLSTQEITPPPRADTPLPAAEVSPLVSSEQATVVTNQEFVTIPDEILDTLSRPIRESEEKFLMNRFRQYLKTNVPPSTFQGHGPIASLYAHLKETYKLDPIGPKSIAEGQLCMNFGPVLDNKLSVIMKSLETQFAHRVSPQEYSRAQKYVQHKLAEFAIGIIAPLIWELYALTYCKTPEDSDRKTQRITAQNDVFFKQTDFRPFLGYERKIQIQILSTLKDPEINGEIDLVFSILESSPEEAKRYFSKSFFLLSDTIIQNPMNLYIELLNAKLTDQPLEKKVAFLANNFQEKFWNKFTHEDDLLMIETGLFIKFVMAIAPTLIKKAEFEASEMWDNVLMFRLQCPVRPQLSELTDFDRKVLQIFHNQNNSSNFHFMIETLYNLDDMTDQMLLKSMYHQTEKAYMRLDSVFR